MSIVFRALGVAAAVAFLSGSTWAFQAPGHVSDIAPVPDAAALLAEVQKNQKAIDSLVEQYACRKNVEELARTKSGGFRTSSVKDYEVFYLGGREVDRLVAEGGKPLPPDKQQDETARVEKKIRKFERSREKQAEREARGEKEEATPGISAFLRVERFTNPRRVEFRDQSVVAFDFEPNPGYHPKTRLESVLQKLVGTAWVDERARQIVRLEAHFGNSYKFGGGLLATVHQGSAFVFEQALVNDEVWLPSYAEMHMSARLLLKGLRLDRVIHYSDYRKFRVETLTKAAHEKAKGSTESR